MGFFSKRKVTFYEVEKDIDLSDGGRSPFSFSVPSVIEETNVCTYIPLQDRSRFPIPMSGTAL